MQVIYEPKGKAREYSPLALNIYNGCDHLCKYCYVQTQMNKNQFGDVLARRDILNQLESDCKKGIDKQVLLSFTGDPYCNKDKELQLTRECLKIMLKYEVPVAILSKGGDRILRDLDLIKKFGTLIKVGATLTFDNNEHSQYYEKGGANPENRIDTLKVLFENNVRTWVSLEPVFSLEQSLNLIYQTKDFVYEYKIGKLNHYRVKKEVDWKTFLNKAVEMCEKYKKDYYIKDDLFVYDKSIKIKDINRNKDYLTIKKEKKSTELF